MSNLRIFTLKFALLASACAATSAYAQDGEADQAEEQEIIVTGKVATFGATKSDAPIAETPRSVSVITSDEFEARGALSLSNTFNYTAGVTGNAFGLSTRSDGASIRGLDAPQYQDNLDVQFGFFNSARAEIYTLEQVEILKGPASVLYGQAAPGGIVSTVSKIAGPDQLEKELVLTIGNFDRYQAAADIGVDLTGDGTLTARFVGLYRNSDTEIDFVGDDSLVIAPSLTFDNGQTSITALFNYTERDSDADSQFLPLLVTACQDDDVTFSNPDFCANAPAQGLDNSAYLGEPDFNRFDTDSVTASIFVTHEFSDFLTFEGTARYRDGEAQYFQTWPTFLGDGNPRVQPDGTPVFRSFFGGPSGADQFAFDARLRANFDTGPIEHEVLGGVNYQDVSTFTNQGFIAAPTAFNVLDPVYGLAGIPTLAELAATAALSEDETSATDFYVVDRMTIGDLVLDAGIRYSSVESEDANSTQNDEEYPITLGALYKTGIGLNPYVSYAESFRATVGTDVIANAPLLPRRGEQFEAGFKFQPEGSRIYVAAAYFNLEENNLVEFRAAGSTQPGRSIESEGVEVEAIIGVGDFTFDANFRHQDAVEVFPEGTIPGQGEFTIPRASLPDTTLSLWTMWEPTGETLSGLRVGAGFRYVSERESNGLVVVGSVPTINRIAVDSVTVFDGLLGYDFNNGLSLSVNARNLFNKQYYATCLSRGDCFAGEQRTIVGTLAFRF